MRQNHSCQRQENLHALLHLPAPQNRTQGETMRLIEIYLWCILYLATYLLVSLTVNLLTGWGDLIGITLIGLLLTLILAIILLWQDEREQREFEEAEPAEIIPCSFENQELLEVNQHAKKEKTRPNTTRTTNTSRLPVGEDLWLRTDVRLDELHAPNERVLSSCGKRDATKRNH